MTYALNGNELGDIQALKHSKRTRIQVMPLPLADSDETESFDVGGVVRTVRVTAIYGETSPTPSAFATTIQNLVDGDQKKAEGDFGYTYHDDFLNVDINVKIESFDFEFRAGSPNEIDYTLELVETTNTT